MLTTMNNTQNIPAIIAQIKAQSQLNEQLKGQLFEYKPLISAWFVFKNRRKATFYGFELQNSIQQIKHRKHMPIVDLLKAFEALNLLMNKSKDLAIANIYLRHFRTGESIPLIKCSENGIETINDITTIGQKFLDQYALWLFNQIQAHEVICDYTNRKQLIF